ncbi:MAG: RNA-binding domain-containing protein [Halobacteriota archaeon]
MSLEAPTQKSHGCRRTERAAGKQTAKRDELPDVEFKESAGSTFFESICTLANASGGIVVLGVDKHGAIVGVPPTSEYLDKVTNQIVSLLSIHPKIEVVDSEGKRAVVVTIPKCRPLPHS